MCPKKVFLLTLPMYLVNKSFIDATGLLASLSLKLLFPALKNLLSIWFPEKKAVLESQSGTND